MRYAQCATHKPVGTNPVHVLNQPFKSIFVFSEQNVLRNSLRRALENSSFSLTKIIFAGNRSPYSPQLV